jgi:hypothetical protein
MASVATAGLFTRHTRGLTSPHPKRKTRPHSPPRNCAHRVHMETFDVKKPSKLAPQSHHFSGLPLFDWHRTAAHPAAQWSVAERWLHRKYPSVPKDLVPLIARLAIAGDGQQ